MKESLPLDDEALELLVAEATDDFLERVERGEQPSAEEYCRRYPQIAGMLRELLPTVRWMHHSSSENMISGDATDHFSPEHFSPGAGTLGAGEVFGALGDYRIVREIGRGGMGIVYEAQQISLNRRVALKVLPFAAALDPKQLERFKHEAQAAAQLHHTHIVPVYAVGCERGVYYYAMQFIEGQSLSQLIHQMVEIHGRDAKPRPGDQPAKGAGDRVTDTTIDARRHDATLHSIESPAHFRTVANLGAQAAEALEHAHSLGVVHRDIKPGNLLLDAAGNLWVADFGLARFQADAAITRSGDLLGTLRYMSPEQALAKRAMVDHRTDIYALGATLYELLTLEPVLAGHDRHELLSQIAFEEPVAPRLFNEAIPVDLETIVLKAMAKAVEDRYATAQELADDLRRFLDDKPILAKPPTLWEKAGRWSRRHRTAVLSAVALLVVAVVGLATATALVFREARKAELAYQAEAQQRTRAEDNFQQARSMLDFFTQVSADDLADKPGVQSVRKKLLQGALDYYENFIEQSGDDPSVHAALAASRLRVANILDEIGSQPDARLAFEQARELAQKLVDEHPTVEQYQHDLFTIERRLAFFHGRLPLLTQKSVQEDLKLSDDEIKQVLDLVDQQLTAAEALRNLNFEERKGKFDALVAAGEKQIANLLDPEQVRRLDQISLQERGPLAFQDSKVAEALALTDAQRNEIQQLLPRPVFGWRRPGPGGGDARSAHGAGVDPPPRPPHDARVELNDDHGPGGHHLRHSWNSQKATMEKLLALLTPEQKTKWADLTGEPFKGAGRMRPAWHGPEADSSWHKR